MNEISMNAIDRDQIRLFDRLRHQADVTARQLADLWCIDESTVYRIWRGESLPSYRMMRELMLHSPLACGIILSDFRRGTDWLCFEVTEATGDEIDARLIQSLRDMADLLDQRRRIMADGMLTAQEKREFVEGIDRYLGMLHTLRAQVADQPTNERRQARAVKTSGGAA